MRRRKRLKWWLSCFGKRPQGGSIIGIHSFFDAYNEAVRRVSENSVNIEDGQENELLPDQAQQLKQHKRDLKIIKNELRRSASQLKWMIKISIFGMLITLLWMFLEQFFL